MVESSSEGAGDERAWAPLGTRQDHWLGLLMSASAHNPWPRDGPIFDHEDDYVMIILSD